MSYLAQLLPPEELMKLDARSIRLLEGQIDKELNTSPEVLAVLKKSMDKFLRESRILERPGGPDAGGVV